MHYLDDHQFLTFTPAIHVTDGRLVRLGHQLDHSTTMEEATAILRRITKWGGLEAVEILAALLDDRPISLAAVGGLVTLGPEAIPTLERVAHETEDPGVLRHATMALRRINRDEPPRAWPVERRAA
ncbi:MAG TPA: hypothetical protein VIF09_20110 [Polyangiaceae bacterium]|jgi:HEAT repeat protein